MYPYGVTDPWRAGTRSVHACDGDLLVTVVLDNPDQADEIVVLSRVGDLDLSGIEIRTSFAGPSRGSADMVADILLVVQQVALGAAGSGVWASIQTLIDRILSPRASKDRVLNTSRELPQVRVSVTVMIPTERGPALVQRVTVGPQDLAEERLSVERIVQSLISGTDRPAPA